jgi:hypothetical protein
MYDVARDSLQQARDEFEQMGNQILADLQPMQSNSNGSLARTTASDIAISIAKVPSSVPSSRDGTERTESDRDGIHESCHWES